MAGGSRPRDGARTRRGRPGRGRRFLVEVLEDRTAPAVWNIASGMAADLIAAINTANSNGDASNTINLAGTYALTAVDHDAFGPTGLPTITSNLTINGSSTIPAAIVRSAADGTPDFRLIEVSGGDLGDPYGTLTLHNLTLANGVARGEDSAAGGGGLGAGGSIFNMGSVTLEGVTITGSRAIGGSGSTGSTPGGGLGATGSEALDGFGVGGDSDGGDGMGGAIFNFTGSLTVINATIAGNEAGGGPASPAGSAGGGYGGGVFNLNGSVILVNATFTGNAADTDGLDLSSLAYGREWRTGAGFTPGGPASADLAMANSLLVSSGAGQSALVSRTDGSPQSMGAGGDDAATVEAAMVGASSPSSAVRGVSGTFASGSVETASIPILDPAGLANRGGPTQTIAVTGSRLAGIAPGNAVFGQDIPAVDQRGAMRPAAGGDAGAVQVTGPPTAALTSAPPANAAVSAATTTAIVVAYADQSGLGLDPSTFGTGNITVNNGATVTGVSVSGATVTYTIAAPTAAGTTWGDAPQGAYEVSVVAGSVRDLTGGSIAAAVLGSFLVDVVLPTATLNSAPTLNGSSGGLSTQTLMVIYTDRGAGIDPASLGTGSLAVSNGATVTGVSASGSNVYYTVTAPASSWASSPQGRYYVSLGAGSVKDLAGNPIAGVSSFGTFMVDTIGPTASLTAAPAVHAATSGKTTTVTVTYSDAASGVSPLSFSKTNITVNNGATVTGYSAAGNVVTYTITAPASTWAASPQGAYTLSLATTAKDFAGNAASAVANLGSFTVDTIAPAATLASAPTVNAATPDRSTTVVITYDGGISGLNLASLGKGNVTVGNGATVTDFSASGNAVAYTVTAPEATWGDSPQGVYTIAVVAGGVKDGAGNPIAAVASLGAFLVDTTPPSAALSSAPTVRAEDAGLATTTVAVAYDGGTSGLDASTFGVGNITIGNGAAVTGYSVTGDVVTYTITAPSESWAESPQGAYAVTLVAGSVKDGAGNPIAGPLLLGSFQVACVTITASLVAATTVNSSSAAESTTTVTIAYNGGSSGLDQASLGTGNIAVSRGATVTSFRGSGDEAIYTITAPASSWADSPQGTYAISIVAGSVKSSDGSAIAGNPSFASFLVDTVAPAAVATSTPTVTASGAAARTTTVVVSYADATSGLDVSSLGVGNIAVSNGAVVTGYSVAGGQVTYTIAATASNWSASPQGSYAISLVAGSVKDLAGNAIAGNPNFGAFLVDTTSPAATLIIAPTVNAASTSNTTTVTITFSDATSGVDPSTLGEGNLAVDNDATVAGYSVSGNAVSYTIKAPSTTWASSPQGTYALAVLAGSVRDLAGNGIAGVAGFGSFLVDVVAPGAMLVSAAGVGIETAGTSTTTATIRYADATSGVAPSTFGTSNIAVSNGATVTGYSVSGNVVTYTIHAPGASWSAGPAGSYAISIVAGSVKDLAGNPIAGDPSLGNFVVDLTRFAATTTLAIAPGSATFGQPVRLTATVSATSGSSRPGGSVVFREGGTTLARAAIGSDGMATATLAASLAVGSHAIVASYQGDSLFAPTDSAASTLAVARSAVTSTALTSSATSVYQGQTVTLTATFQAGSDGATPMTGTVAFYDGPTYLGAAAIGSTLSGSTATARASFSTAPLAAGSHAFRVVYSGDASYAAASADAAVTVIPATTAVSLTVATSAQSATLNASVAVTSPGQVVLAGTVNFYDSGSLVGSADLSGGSAALTLGNLAAGVHAFTAAYAGGTGIAAASSAAVGASIAATPPNVASIVIQSVRRKPPVVVITFDRAVDPAATATAAGYAVIGPIVGKKPGKPIRVISTAYNAAAHTVTLSFKVRLTAAKSYRLTIADLGFTAVFKGKGIVGR